MQAFYDGTVIGGQLQLDQRIELADMARVHVTVALADEGRSRLKKALASLAELRTTHPIHSGGLKFTREQLYERG